VLCDCRVSAVVLCDSRVSAIVCVVCLCWAGQGSTNKYCVMVCEWVHAHLHGLVVIG
jgi:integral membrane sensor domain MASE1